MATKRWLGFAALVGLSGIAIGVIALRSSPPAATPPEQPAVARMPGDPGAPPPAAFDERWSTGWAPAAAAPVLAQIRSTRLDGGRPHRNERWAARMQRVGARARDELHLGDEDSARLQALQADLRRFKQQVRQSVVDGHFTRKQGDQLLRRRAARFQTEVGQVIGPEHVTQYLAIVKDVRLADRVE